MDRVDTSPIGSNEPPPDAPTKKETLTMQTHPIFLISYRHVSVFFFLFFYLSLSPFSILIRFPFSFSFLRPPLPLHRNPNFPSLFHCFSTNLSPLNVVVSPENGGTIRRWLCSIQDLVPQEEKNSSQLNPFQIHLLFQICILIRNFVQFTLDSVVDRRNGVGDLSFEVWNSWLFRFFFFFFFSFLFFRFVSGL